MIQQIIPLDRQWPTQGPFLFCAHHLDFYPAGNAKFGLDAHHFAGRNLGADFVGKDGFSLYHGKEIPGFPVHPHRGFETITIVRKGLADHADSLGSAGRYGQGDVQWMTAGSGVQHSEMFPLLQQDRENTLELFQLWLNLPRKSKMAPPDFKMLWSENIPKIKRSQLEVTLICGSYLDHQFHEAPKNSWANDISNDVNILLIKMESGAAFHYPGKKNLNRSLYLFDGPGVMINGQKINGHQALFLDSTAELVIEASENNELVLLEGRPIDEPVFQYGPFVMNTREDMMQTIRDYQTTQFGGWKWPRQDMIHGPGMERFAQYPDGRIERPRSN